MALFHRVYRVLDRKHGCWTEWTSINPNATDTAESQPTGRSEIMGYHSSGVFQNMIAGGWHTFGNEFQEFTIRLVKSEDVTW